MHPEILAPDTATAFAALKYAAWMTSFYLAGGTAVALHLGHRQSVDLDFFSSTPFSTQTLRQQVMQCGDFRLEQEGPGTLHGMLCGAKVSFLEYPYPCLEPPVLHDGLHIASLQDLACMKLDTIGSRGKKRDFIDLHAILATGVTLPTVFQWFATKYQALQYNQMHLIKSLTYFQDAEFDPSPVLLHPVEWIDIKQYFQHAVRAMVP